MFDPYRIQKVKYEKLKERMEKESGEQGLSNFQKSILALNLPYKYTEEYKRYLELRSKGINVPEPPYYAKYVSCKGPLSTQK